MFSVVQTEAGEALQWYRGPKYDITAELAEIVEKAEEQQRSGRNLRQTVISLPFLRAFSCASVLFFFCNFTGIATLVVYMSNVFQDSGLTFPPGLAPVIIGAVRVLTACCSSAALRTANRLHLYSACSLGTLVHTRLARERR